MPTCPLPSDPSFENLKKLAKSLLAAARAHEAAALARFREFHPRPDEALAKPALADAQLVLARTFGFASWARLKRHLAVVEEFLWDPPEDPLAASGTAADTLVRLACVNYGRWHPSMAERARRLLSEHPEIPRASIHAAATVGDVAAAREWLEREPALAQRKGGPLAWEPLLHAAYSRLDSDAPGHSTLEVARLLLEHGADPNAGFLWCGNVPPFTALTGAFGEGEGGSNQPPHRHRDALARLLLEDGADPNDGQTLYNKHFNPDDAHFRLLFEYGLGQDRHGPWYARLGDRLQSPRQLLVEELWAAARKGLTARVALLVAHGTDVNGRGVRDGRTPYEEALHGGNREIAELLARHGARRVELAPEEDFASLCIAGERERARALLERAPDLVERLGPERRGGMVGRAVEARSHAGVRLMAELGFDMSPLTRNTPLHDAAWAGDLETVKLLLALGADPTVRDREFHGTPLGWAAYNRQHAVIACLLPFADVFDAVRVDAVERVAALLREDPARARAVDAQGCPLVFYVHAGSKRTPELLALLVQHGADLNARDRSDRTALDAALANGHDQLADELRRLGGRASRELPPS